MRSADSAHAAAPPRPAREGDPPLRHGPTVATIVWIALLGVLTLAHPSTSRMLTWPWAIATAAVWLEPVVLVIWRLTTRGLFGPGNLGLSLGPSLLAVACVGSAVLGPFPGQSLVRTWPTLGGVALFLSLCDWLATPANTPARQERVARVLACFGAGILIVSLANWLNAAWPSSPWGSRNTFPFGHSNYTAGLVVLALPWLAERAGTAKAWARAGWVAAIIAALVTLASTSSRGAVLAIVVVTTAFAAVGLWRARWPARHKVALLAAAAAAMAAVVLPNPRLRDLALRREWSDSAVESNRQRSAMLTAGLRLGAERPWLGWGPGSVPLAYPQVRATLDGGVDNVLQVHSTPLQLWATGGMLALGASALIGGGLLAATMARLKNGPLSSITLAAAASTLGYAVFALTDHQLDVPMIAAFVVANASLLACAENQPVPRGALGRRFALAALAVALIGAPLVALGRDLLARRAYEQAIVAWERGRGDDVLAALDRATRLTPYDPFFQHHAAATLLQASESATGPARSDLRRAAAARLTASLATGVHAEFAHFNLGWLQLEFGAPTEAVRHFRAAAALVPDKGGVYFGLGLALQQNGARDAAVRAFALEWLNDPRSAFSPAWELPAFAALRPAVQAETLRLYDQVQRDHPPARVAGVWMRWWLGEPLRAADLVPGFSHASTAFAAALPAMAARRVLPTDAPWASLYAAWRTRAAAPGYLRAAAGDREFAAALARRAARHGDDFREFLMAGTEEEPALLRTFRRQRIGYGILAAHPDGPPLTDLYLVQENRVLAAFAADLFPAKGWLPGRCLQVFAPQKP